MLQTINLLCRGYWGWECTRPAALIVSGKLHIGKGSQEALKKFLSITVNGPFSYPSDMKEQLRWLNVNGSTDCYPGQRSAVEHVSKDVGRINDLGKMGLIRIKEMEEGLHLFKHYTILIERKFPS